MTQYSYQEDLQRLSRLGWRQCCQDQGPDQQGNLALGPHRAEDRHQIQRARRLECVRLEERSQKPEKLEEGRIPWAE